MGWFKRIHGGITTSTNEKKKSQRDYGINVQSVNTLHLQKNI